MPRDVLQLDLTQVDPNDVDEIYKGAMFNLDIPSSDVLAIMEVAVKVEKPKLHSKKKKWEEKSKTFKIHADMRLD